MARGLMQNAAPAPAGPPQGGMPGGGAPPSAPLAPGPGGQERRASDEEKGVYREFLANIINSVYEEKTAAAVGEIIHSTASTPDGASAVEPLAQIISGTVARVAYSGLDNGMPITREMAAAAAASLAADLGRNMAESVGVPPMSDDQIQATYLRSMELLADRRDQGQAEGATPQDGGEPPPPGNGLMMAREEPPPNRRARRAQAAQQRRNGRGA